MTKKQQTKKSVDTKKEESAKVVSTSGKQEQRDVSKSESSSAATSGVQSTDVDPSITTHAPRTRPSTIGLDTIYARTGSEEHHDEASPREPSKTTAIADISSTTTKAKKETKHASESSASATSESGDVDPSITTHAPSTRPSTIGIDTIYARTGSGEHVSSPRESSKTTGESGSKELLETKQRERVEKRKGASEHARSDDAVHDYGNLQPATEDLARQGKSDTKESKGGNVKEKKGEGKGEGKNQGKSVKGEEKKVEKEKEVEGVHGGKEKGHKKEGGHKKEKPEHKSRGREGHGRKTRLSSGHDMPLLAFGTWKLEKDEIPEAIKGALEAGFRHIDCAQDYMNEDSVGDALKAAFDKGTVSREDLFITSKLNQQYHDPKHVKAQLRKTLSDLRLDNLDLFLMHWPIAMSHVPFDENQRGYSEDYAKRRKEVTPNTRISIRDTWLAMEECVKGGLTKSIGVSNFPVALLHDLLSYCNIPPAVNQVELHPYLQQNNLVNYCNSRDVAVMGYSSLGSGSDPSLLDDSELQDIAEQLHITPAQLCLAWGLSRDIGAVVRSSNTEHIAENMQAWKLADQLKDDVKKRIERLDRGHRFLRPENLSVFGGVPLFD